MSTCNQCGTVLKDSSPYRGRLNAFNIVPSRWVWAWPFFAIRLTMRRILAHPTLSSMSRIASDVARGIVALGAMAFVIFAGWNAVRFPHYLGRAFCLHVLNWDSPNDWASPAVLINPSIGLGILGFFPFTILLGRKFKELRVS